MSQNSCLLGEEDTTVPGWEESAPQVDDLLRLVFKIQCFIIIKRDKQDPQILGNVALILIQVVLFALFQLVEYYDKGGGGDWLVGGFAVLLGAGILLFIGASKMKFPSIIFLIQGLVITIAFLTGAKPESGKEDVGWIVKLTVFQTFNLLIAGWASTEIKSTWKTA